MLQVGGAVLRVRGQVKRCVATTRDPDSGVADLQTLRMITNYRGRQESVLGMGACFGVYAEVVEPGEVAVGDLLRPATGPVATPA
ncbi:MOSC domain-containing protein [Nocardioides sp. AX2bis]|uniref:MOSC domain-containing protein n=1 Tax=Nocardioides sp. AX2bis TaxID=2653157 RepID=UPI003FA59936